VRNRLLAGNSDFINGIGYLLALSALIAVELNVRKTYVSIHGASQDRVAGVQKLVIGQSKIRAGKYFYVPFRIDGAMEGAHIVGKFHTSGGPDKMVQVVVAEQNQLGHGPTGTLSRYFTRLRERRMPNSMSPSVKAEITTWGSVTRSLVLIKVCSGMLSCASRHTNSSVSHRMKPFVC
jgi:hypothetical protein